MKKFLSSIVILASAVIAAQAVSFQPIGPAEFKVNAFTQGENFTVASSKTNTTATSTNTTTVFKSTVIKTSFGNASLLALLTNSFNTNFPAGSQIAIRFPNVYVVDSTGTNVIFDPSSVVTFQFDETFVSGMDTQVISQKTTGFSVSGNDTELLISSAILNYNDSILTTADGTHTTFQFKGFMSMKESVNLGTDAEKKAIEFQGTGGGPIRNVPTILNGTITVKAVGKQPLV